MKILPGRTALKTLDTMALCTARCLPPFLEITILYCSTSNSTVECSGCLEICRELLDSICRFSFLKRCSYSLYSDTMLNIGSIRIYILTTGVVSNETNEDVRMYIGEFILVDIWIHCCTKLKWRCMEKYWFIYTRNKGLVIMRNALRSLLTSES